MRFKEILIITSLCLLLISLAFAEVPRMINYQGLITDLGKPLTDTMPIVFAIYADSIGGSPLWREFHNQVVIENGIFNVILGSVKPIPDSVFNGEVRYLSMAPKFNSEMTPRAPIVSVGYAYRAGTAGTDEDWTISGNDMYSTISGNVGIGTRTPLGKLDVHGTLNAGRLAMGFHSEASGYSSVAIGYYTTASGEKSTAIGEFTTVRGNHSIGLGPRITANANSSTAIGPWTSTEGVYSIAIGHYAAGNGHTSIAIGKYVTADSVWSIVLGSGESPDQRLISNRSYSLMVGFRNTTPTLFVDSSSVGIGTTSPTGKFDVNGNDIRIRSAQTPASSSADGFTGEIAWDANYIYICTSGDGPGGGIDMWKRAALSSW